MKRDIEIKATPKEVAELLFELDSIEVGQFFSEWNKLFDEEYENRKKEGKPIFIFDLNHFMLYVIDKMDDKGLDIIRSMYASMVYKMCDKISMKHKLDLQ